MSRLRIRVSSLMLLVVVLSSARVGAQTINVTSGFLDMNTYVGPLLLGGEGGFTFVTQVDNVGGVWGPFDCNSDPNRCVPGNSVSLRGFWSGSAAGGTATLDGVTYTRIGSQSSLNSMTVEITGSAVLPPMAASATITASFTLSGQFTHQVGDGPATTTRNFAGSGTAVVTLVPQTCCANSWYIQRVQYTVGTLLPFGWMSADVGHVGLEGSAASTNSGSSSSRSFNIAGAGADIWGTADSFRFASQPFPSDGEVIVRVVSEQNTHAFAKAGLMLRQSHSATAPHVILDVKPDGVVEFMTRSTDGGTTRFVSSAAATFPVWLRLTRTGSMVVGWVSADGASYTAFGSAPIDNWPSNSRPLGGLAVTSHDPTVLNQAVFDNVSLTAVTGGAELPKPWSDAEVGTVSEHGSASFTNGTFTVRGDGADIWGSADAFHYAYRSIVGDGDIVARVTSLQNTNAVAKAGVMLRQSLHAGSRHVILNVTPSGGIEFMTRAANDGPTTYLGGGTQPFPSWLKLTRAGSLVTGYISSNGTKWTAVGSTTVSMDASALIGLAVNSHSSTLATASFDNVNVTSSAPPAETTGEVVIYAKDVAAANLHGGWTLTADATAAGGMKLTTPDAGLTANAFANPSANDHYVDVTFDAAGGTPYTLWLRLRALGDNKFNDSLWVQFSDATVNGAPVFPIGTSDALLVNLATDAAATSLSGWGWVNGAYWLRQPATFTFPTGGPHTLRIQVREDAVQFDQIVLSRSTYLNDAASCPTTCDGAPGSVSSDSTIVPKP